MYVSDRRFLCAGILTTAPSGLLLCALLCWPDLLADAWQSPCVKAAFPAEQRREEDLNRHRAVLRRRAEVKTGLVRDVADGRLTLLEAAARLRELDRATPDFPWEVFRLGRPGMSDEERHCRELIGHLRGDVVLESGDENEVVRRWEEELRLHLERGTLQLPDVAPYDTLGP
jgi:hypothetical protein